MDNLYRYINIYSISLYQGQMVQDTLECKLHSYNILLNITVVCLVMMINC